MSDTKWAFGTQSERDFFRSPFLHDLQQLEEYILSLAYLEYVGCYIPPTTKVMKEMLVTNQLSTIHPKIKSFSSKDWDIVKSESQELQLKWKKFLQIVQQKFDTAGLYPMHLLYVKSGDPVILHQCVGGLNSNTRDPKIFAIVGIQSLGDITFRITLQMHTQSKEARLFFSDFTPDSKGNLYRKSPLFYSQHESLEFELEHYPQHEYLEFEFLEHYVQIVTDQAKWQETICEILIFLPSALCNIISNYSLLN